MVGIRYGVGSELRRSFEACRTRFPPRLSFLFVSLSLIFSLQFPVPTTARHTRAIVAKLTGIKSMWMVEVCLALIEGSNYLTTRKSWPSDSGIRAVPSLACRTPKSSALAISPPGAFSTLLHTFAHGDRSNGGSLQWVLTGWRVNRFSRIWFTISRVCLYASRPLTCQLYSLALSYSLAYTDCCWPTLLHMCICIYSLIQHSVFRS